jgi:hypothetical protein
MSMTLNEIATRMPAWYVASCEDDGPAFHLESDAGRGKTTVMKRFPEIMKAVDPEGDYGFVYINGLTITLPWLCGFMQMNVDAQLKKSVSHFSLPYWWITKDNRPIDSYSGGMIFIDEEDKMGPEERKLTRDMKLLKRVGTHWLPPGWVVWSAGNPLGSRNGGTKTFDFIINSQMLIKVRDSGEDWNDWALKNKVLPEVISFAADNPHILFQKAPEVQGPYCTPRSLAQADIYLRSCMSVYSKSKIPIDVTTQAEIAGGIGKEAAEALFMHIRLAQELPSYRECIANPNTVPIPAEPDRLRLFAYKLADWAQPTHSQELGILMSRMPSEFQFMMVKMIRDRNARVLIMPEFRSWCKSNAQLIAIIEGYERQHGHNDPMLSAVAQVA